MVIRRIPSDFLVDELLHAGVLARGPQERAKGFAVLRLTKTSLTTPEAAARLAKALGVRDGAVVHAGLKDKHAVTHQHVSVPAVELGRGVQATASGPGWSAELVGWADEPAAAAWIERNRFAIVVRDLKPGEDRVLRERAGALTPAGEPGSLLLLNYFGDQRFGSARHHEGFAAEALIHDDFERALKLLIATPARKDSGVRRTFTRQAAAAWGDWKPLAAQLPRCPDKRAIETLAAGGSFRDAFTALPHGLQQLTVEAFQSHLWNAIAGRIARTELSRGTPPLLSDDPFGELAFPIAPSVVEPWASLQPPMPAADMPMDGPWSPHAAAELASRNLAASDLRIKSLRRPAFASVPRPLFVRARNFSISEAHADDLGRAGRQKALLSFDLPRGAYATIALRALGQ